jgi:hypothetical protein
MVAGASRTSWGRNEAVDTWMVSSSSSDKE